MKLLGSLLGEAFETTGPKERGQPLGNGSAPAPHGCPGPHRARSPRGGPAGASRAASLPEEPGAGAGLFPGPFPPRPRVSRIPPGPPGGSEGSPRPGVPLRSGSERFLRNLNTWINSSLVILLMLHTSLNSPKQKEV